MVDEAAAINKASELRPPAVRAIKVPIPPPWNCIATAFDRASELLPSLRPLKVLIPRPCKFLSSTFVEGPDILRACQEQQCQTSSRVVSEGPIACLDSEDMASSSTCQVAGSFSNVVPRTSEVLNWYFENICSRDLQLFPKIHTGENCKIDWVKSSTDSRDIDKKLCFVRVLLHAYKEGVFEEGAMICAPLSRDLSRWTSRFAHSQNLSHAVYTLFLVEINVRTTGACMKILYFESIAIVWFVLIFLFHKCTSCIPFSLVSV